VYKYRLLNYTCFSYPRFYCSIMRCINVGSMTKAQTTKAQTTKAQTTKAHTSIPQRQNRTVINAHPTKARTDNSAHGQIRTCINTHIHNTIK
jgi:ribosomal protein S30